MTSAAGLQLKTHRRWFNDTVELLSSMRFAISLLTMIAIASIIGTVLKQNEPMPNYVNQFGPFWVEVFDKLGLYSVYSAWWFLTIMGFLVASTMLCIIRNAPKMLKDMRSWRENVREQSLRNFHHKAEWQTNTPLLAAVQQTINRIATQGYKSRVFEKDGGTLISAKQGAVNKWGYIFAHSAIVIICIGGLLDSDLPIRVQEWAYGKTPYVGGNVTPSNRLGLGNPTFRGSMPIPEGSSSDTAIIPRQTGILMQSLPFTIQLKKFIIEHYSTGMPKLFASEVVITDHETGKSFPATIKVNEPLIYKGVAVYQSSFDDGGSKLKLVAWPMSGTKSNTFALNGEVGGATPLKGDQGGEYTIEWSDFRAFNVENVAQGGQDVRAVNLNKSFAEKLDKQLGSAAKSANNKDFKNVGPSVQYKLRDKTGQAREYHNYMQPVLLDGAWVFVSGMRESPGDSFQYLHIPADDNDSVKEWMRIRAALADPDLRAKAAQRYAERIMPASRENAEVLRTQLRESARKGLDVFAGDGKEAGFLAVAHFLEKLPAAEQEKAVELFMKILNGGLWELWQAAREKDGLMPAEPTDKHARFMQLAENALSDSMFYGAPVYLQLKEFDEVKASVFQVTRSPGKKVVYLGCLLLVIGVFSMFYIRERRLWIWFKSGDNGATHALMAVSTQRKTLDFEKEFERLKLQLTQP